MLGAGNSVSIESGKVIIRDQKRPVRILFYLAMLLFGLQGIFQILSYERTGGVHHLIFGVVLAFLLGLFASRELFFRTYRKELDINEIVTVQIQNVPFGKENVYLRFKLKNKIRVVFIDRRRAEEVKRELDPLK